MTEGNSMINKNWPIILISIIYLLIVLGSLFLSIHRNQGHLVYALDDPYIHMAYAKNFVEHSIWGVTAYHFSSATSSLSWTMLVTGCTFLFGLSDFTPLILNIIAVLAALIVIFVVFCRNGLENRFNFIALILILFCTPMTALTFSGMEHDLHLFLAIPFIYLSAKILAADSPSMRQSVLLFIVAPLMIMTRYEGLLMLGVTVLLFLIRRKYLFGIMLGIVAVIPICIYGFVSLSHDWWFFPNSVLLKGNMPASSSPGRILFFFYMGLRRLVENSHLMVLLGAAAYLLYKKLATKKFFRSEATIMLTVYIASSLLHLLFARTSWFFRYEAYLVGVGLFVLAYSLRNSHIISGWKWPNSINLRTAVSLVAIFIIASPFILRAGQSLIRIQQATRNIYEQQFQMARFLHEYYDGQAVGANDIGAINYYADIDCFDLWGLGTMEVARARISGAYDSDLAYRMTRDYGVKIAIIYKEWFDVDVPGGVPREWIPVGTWRILDNKICGDDVVNFYAVDPDEKDRLVASLREFSEKLPARVIQGGYYTETR